MKVAYVEPHCFEHLFPEEACRLSPEQFDRSILAQLDHISNRYCHASLSVGIDTTLYFLSSFVNRTVQFSHRDGYRIKKVPVDLTRGRLGTYGWDYSFSLINELSRDQPDLILIFSYAVNPAVLLDMYDIMAVWSRMKGIPLVARHGGGTAKCWFRGKRSIPGRIFTKKMALKIAARIIVPSRLEYAALKDDLNIDATKLVYLPNSVDLTKFNSELPRDKACNLLHKDPHKKYVLFVGRLQPHKGPQHLIAVLPSLKEINPNITLLLVGSADFRGDLQARTVRLGVQKDVHFEGFVFHDKLFLYYRIADVFVLPSQREGTPSVLQEAVSCGVPCVASNVGGNQDILSEGVGILVPAQDEDALLCGIRRVLEGDFRLDETRRAKLLEMWDQGTFPSRLKKIFEDILR
jgi:glycosyltransferase involved in cell wall biosynthesis